MNMAQRIVGGVFAAILGVVAFGSMDSGDTVVGLMALLAGMGLVLWALRPED